MAPKSTRKGAGYGRGASKAASAPPAAAPPAAAPPALPEPPVASPPPAKEAPLASVPAATGGSEDTAGGKKRKLLLANADEVEAAFQQEIVGNEATAAADGSPPGTPGSDGKEKKEKKDKKDKKEKKERKEGEDVEKEGESDTEYPDVELGESPELLHVKNSGHPKIDGPYKRLDKPSRGRPCYSMQREGKKPVYLFWYKNSKWYISFELGASKNLARVEDSGVDGRKLPPCEPHPYAWKVVDATDKDSKRKNYMVAAPMRIIDAGTIDPSAEVELGNEPETSSRHSSSKKPRKHTHRPSASKPTLVAGAAAVAKPHAAPAAAAAAPLFPGGQELDEEAAAAEAAAGGDTDTDDEDEAQAAVPQKKEDSDKDSDTDSGSDSDSSKSSSSEASAPAHPSPKAAAPAAAGAPPPAAGAPLAPPPKAGATQNGPQGVEEKEKKREAFVGKLRTQLENIKDPKQRQQKLSQVRAMLKDRADHLLKVVGMSEKEVKGLMDSLDRDFGPKGKPKQPPSPPPKHLLSRAKAPNPAPDGSSAASSAAGGAPGKAAPATPPETEQYPGSAAADPQRTSAPLRSSLKKSSRPRFQMTPRIGWRSMTVSQVGVESYRSYGEQLWFQMPGAFVTCDHCEKSVPQSLGALQGEPSRPQFAQCQFYCSECVPTPNRA